jgi:hypothetical protein
MAAARTGERRRRARPRERRSGRGSGDGRLPSLEDVVVGAIGEVRVAGVAGCPVCGERSLQPDGCLTCGSELT